MKKKELQKEREKNVTMESKIFDLGRIRELIPVLSAYKAGALPFELIPQTQLTSPKIKQLKYTFTLGDEFQIYSTFLK